MYKEKTDKKETNHLLTSILSVTFTKKEIICLLVLFTFVVISRVVSIPVLTNNDSVTKMMQEANYTATIPKSVTINHNEEIKIKDKLSKNESITIRGEFVSVWDE